MAKQIVNAMTVDVEDYFQVSAFDDHISRDQWRSIPTRIERNTEVILQMFSDHNTSATFFTLGWIAERFPALVRRISDSGHEVASHGYNHVRAHQQTPEQFLQDVVRTKELLEDITNKKVKGYRAASYSIMADNLWALDSLQEAGYVYSSSIYPIKHDLYGMPEAPRFPFRLKDDGLLEIPVSTVEILHQKLPSGGGGYFRLLPYSVSRWAIHRINQYDGQPSVFYFHPWEIDPKQPRQHGISLKTRFRHYVNLSRMQAKLTQLLKDFEWDRMDQVFLDEYTNVG